ncbi:hypothetical protein DER44DRAFT_770360 [Fusarium oxysporum]|nr:hypothetical protein DER44DRAFT_770360 [Fusarium oxysporum]
MSHSSFVFYLACLAFLCTLITAQSCNTTGSYDACCRSPSFDKKVVNFQGKEFRVHCDSAIVGASAFTKIPSACAAQCSGQLGCVDSYWQTPTPPGQWGSCELRLIQGEAGSVAFVWVDSSEASNELNKCRNDLKNCDTSCPGKLGACQSSLRNCDTSCPSKLGSCETKLRDYDENCPSKLGTCTGNLAKCKGSLETCGPDTRKTCLKKKKLCNCKKPPKNAPFKCTPGTRTIGGARYQVHCYEYQGHFPPNENEYYKVNSFEECARRCTQSPRCQWTSYTWFHNSPTNDGTGGCSINFSQWNPSKTETTKGEVGSLVIVKV